MAWRGGMIMYDRNNKVKDFEFYYLVELTRRKIKPLSRWEKPLSERECHWLRGHGLHAEIIPRSTLSGRQVVETIFSKSSRYTDLYKNKFANMRINKSAESQRLEGFLFGYPSCCVRQFIHHPYFPNRLDRDVQSILFHWACNTCLSTPELIPYYQSTRQSVYEWYNREFPNGMHARTRRRSFSKAIAALALSGGLLSAQTTPDSAHYIPLKNDININGLSYAEEIYLGTYDRGYSLSDCQTYARLFKTIIDSLPDTLQADRAYKIDHMMRGVIQCPICGLSINMGYVTVVNPLRRLQLDISYLGLHFMENGFFSYGSDADYQRVVIDTLKKIIYPFDGPHLLSVTGDSNGDGLTDAEEDSLRIDDTADNPDSNADGVPDGAGIAEELIRLFPKLKEQADGIHSSIEFKPVWGLENCQVCGSIHNMGVLEITNPENKRTCQIPYISLHAMAHGSFAMNGTVHENQRVNVMELYRSMKTHLLFINGDTDNDGLKDEEENHFGFDPNKADSDDDGVSDGMELAVMMADTIKSLPTTPSLDKPYVEYLAMYGVHLCTVCGDVVPMGVIKIYNPLINTISPLEFSNYAFHFLQKGSFASEGVDNARIDPILLSNFLKYSTGVPSDPAGSLPVKFDLKQNYPNPFNLQTVIPYSVSRRSRVSLKVYDIRGHEIKTLVDGVKTPGDKTVIWNGTTDDDSITDSGFYLYRLTVDGASQTKKMLVLK
jgi:hypothetical protein